MSKSTFFSAIIDMTSSEFEIIFWELGSNNPTDFTTEKLCITYTSYVSSITDYLQEWLISFVITSAGYCYDASGIFYAVISNLGKFPLQVLTEHFLGPINQLSRF